MAIRAAFEIGGSPEQHTTDRVHPLDAKHLGEYSLGCALENRRSMLCRVVLTAPKVPTARLFLAAFA